MRYHTTAQGNIPFTPEEEALKDAEEQVCEKDKYNGKIKADIAALEVSVTPRIQREMFLGINTINPKTGKNAAQYIEFVNAKISELASNLKP